MKKILLSLFVLLAMFAATSCKKDKSVVSHTVLEGKILGKWTFLKDEIVSVPADPANAEVFDPPQGSYGEFKSAPNTFTLFNGQSTVNKNWVEVDDSHLSIPTFYDNPFTVEVVNATTIKLSTPYSIGGTNFIETLTFTKP
jgi:hypothetical protein